ncbi:hypothetical protein [Flavobacterium sp. HNIBRBA15423]|uniref:hypothetical protein n=1 Tax=Flavobacterium sp. HNIBRBA15423 TaxID=3458683 RepID=UPI0040445FD7
MKKFLTVLSAITLVFTSCSSDDSPSEETSSGSLLTKIVETYDDGTVETIEFEYNGNKIVRQTSDLDVRDETIFTYTGDLITKEEYFFDDGEGYTMEEVISYEYDSNNRLIKSSRASTGLAEEDIFTYNSNSTISFTTTSTTTSPSTIVATGIIYLNGDQPYKKTITEYPGTIWESSRVEENEFDDKVNPLINVVGLSKTLIACPKYIYGYDGVSNNNLNFKRDNVLEESSTYTYNNNNMPLTENYIDTSNSDYNSVSQYFYN